MVPQEAIFKGATRPAMKFGVPLVPLVVLLGTTILIVLWAGLLVSWWISAGTLAAVLPMGYPDEPPRAVEPVALDRVVSRDRYRG